MEIDVVIRAQTGDSLALSEIYKNMYKRVYYLALRMTNSPEDAEDAAQETFISAFGSLEKLEKPQAFESWLLQICANRCRNLMRKESHTVDLTEDEDGHTILDELVDPNEALIPESVLQNEEQRRLIMETVKALPEEQRECVLLYYYSGVGVKDIAEELDCSEGTVKSRLNYARQKIKDSILFIEKRDGIRLHSLAPIALLFATDLDAVTASLPLPALGGLAAGAAAVGTAAGSAATSTAGASAASAAATTAKVAAGVAVKTKVIAAVAAAAVAVGGGAAVYQAVQEKEPSPYVEFVDAGMEKNMHILLDIPEDEPILKDTLAQIEDVFFVEDGMNIFSEQMVVGWLTSDGDYSPEEEAYGTPLYSIQRIRPAEDTVPVEDLSDLQYFGNEALYIGCLESETKVDQAKLSLLFPNSVVRNRDFGEIKLPFVDSVYWDEHGETRINSQAELDRLECYTLIREPEYVDFVDANMEHSIHTLLEIPADQQISAYEMEQLHQIKFNDNQVDLFLSHYAGGSWTPYQLSELTRMPESFEDLKLFCKDFLLITVASKGVVDEAAIRAVRPDAEFHYFHSDY